MSEQGGDGQTPAPPTHTLRLTFRYEGSDVSLVSSERVEMLPPPGAPQFIHEGQAGSWAELLDAQGHRIYQQLLHNPIRYEMEAPEDPDTGTLHWEEVRHPQGVFEVLVPDMAEGQTLVLFGGSRESLRQAAATERQAAATEIARIRLDEIGWLQR
jgi:hypothetical protein